MFSNCISFLLSFMRDCFGFLDNWDIVEGVSVLGFIVAAYIIYVLVDNFLPKG